MGARRDHAGRDVAADVAADGRHEVHPRLRVHVDTDLVRHSIERVAGKTKRAEAEVLAEYVKETPIRRLIRPQEVAAAVLYLCTPEAAAVTGATLAVAGGEL